MPCRQLLQQVLPVNRSYPANIKRSSEENITKEKPEPQEDDGDERNNKEHEEADGDLEKN